MKVLVTGGSGFIGTNLLLRLEKEKWNTNILVRSESKLRISTNKNKFEIFEGDITKPGSLSKSTTDVDVVFHLAAALPHHHLRPKDYWEVNVTGTKNLLSVLKNRSLKRFVHVSTVGIYGKESPYSESKIAAEETVIKSGIPYTIIRPTIAYGPHDTRPGFLNLLTLIKRGYFVPIGKGDNFFHTVYVGNLIDALVLAGTQDKALNQDFIIGDHPCPTMKDILSSMYKIMNKKYPDLYIPNGIAKIIGLVFDEIQNYGLSMPLSLQRVKFLTESKKFSVVKGQELLGFIPKMNLDDGIKKTYNWYLENGLI